MPKVTWTASKWPEIFSGGISDVKGANIVGGIRIKPGFDYWWFLEYGTAGNEDEFAGLGVTLDRPPGIDATKHQTGPYPITAHERGARRQSPRRRVEEPKRPRVEKHWPDVDETWQGGEVKYNYFDFLLKQRMKYKARVSITWKGKNPNPYRGGLLEKPKRKARRRGGMYVSKSGKQRAWWVKPGTKLAKKYEKRGYVWVENKPKAISTTHKGFLRIPVRRQTSRYFKGARSRWVFRRTVTHPGVKSTGIIRKNIQRFKNNIARSHLDAAWAHFREKGGTVAELQLGLSQALNRALHDLHGKIVADIPLGESGPHLRGAVEVVNATITHAKTPR